MTTETKSKAPAVDLGAEIAALRAELAASKAERDALAAKLANQGGPGRSALPFPSEHLAPEGTDLRWLQGQPRGEVYDAAIKVVRRLPVQDAYRLVFNTAEAVAKVAGEGATAKSVIEAAMVKKTREPKAKVTGDATGEGATA